jgi:hypothetical protein
MASSRNAIKYNSVGLFLTDSPASHPESELLHFFNRVQSASLSVDIERQNVKEIGSEDFLSRKIVSEATTRLQVEYLLTDGHEEKLLGLNVKAKGEEFPTSETWWDENKDGNLVLMEKPKKTYFPAEQWLQEDGVNDLLREEKFYSNIEAAKYFEDGVSGLALTNDSVITSQCGGRSIYCDLKEDKTILMAIGGEAFDLTGYDNRENGYSGIDVIGIGNCYVTDYSISASVGDFAKASVSFAASNLRHSCYGSGDGGHTWLDNVKHLAFLMTQLNGFINLQNGGKVPLGGSEQKVYKAGAPNPSLNLPEKGIDLTGPTIERGNKEIVLGTGIEFNASMYKSPVAAIAPGGIHVKLKNLSMGGPILSGEEAGSCIKGSANIQGFNISLPFQREDLYGFESMHVYGRKMKYPQVGTISFSLLASAFNSGDFRQIFCNDEEYEIEIDLNNQCDFSCQPSSEHETFLKLIMDNAKFDGYSFNESIGSVATVDCNFSFGVSRNHGMFISGSFEDY